MPKIRILITGSAGLIGRVLIEALSKKYDLHGLDKTKTKGIPSIVADISDLNRIQPAFKGIDVVIHLAADPRIDAPWSSVVRNNIVGTYNVFEASRLAGVKKLIFASTNHVTGMYEQMGKRMPETITTKMPICPDSFYGASKAFGEALGKFYSDRYGISVICLRIGSVVKEDRPMENRHIATWLSFRDLVQLVRKSMRANVRFGVYYGVSNNKRRFWDISNAKKELGYLPVDNAERFARKV